MRYRSNLETPGSDRVANRRRPLLIALPNARHVSSFRSFRRHPDATEARRPDCRRRCDRRVARGRARVRRRARLPR
ncbi:hypothetical protein D2W72_37970, partial [Burkholderia pseudomallei]